MGSDRLPWNPAADNCGRVPKEGDFVAYNMSGQIATGFIRHAGRTRSGRLTGRFTIEQVRPEEGHVSRIKGGPKCLLVLDAGPG